MKTISVIACKGNDEIAGMTRKELYFEIVNRLTVDYSQLWNYIRSLQFADVWELRSFAIFMIKIQENTFRQKSFPIIMMKLQANIFHKL